jgi:L,D-transpeptidase YcbB
MAWRHITGGWRAALALALPLAVLAMLLPAPAFAVPEAEVAEPLRRAVEQLRSTGRATVAGQTLLSARALPEIYEARGFRPLWTDPANEEALLGEIAAASGDGLDPEDYHFEALRAALDQRRRLPEHGGSVATADLLLTDALVRLVAHLHFGKLDLVTGQPRWDLVGSIRGQPGSLVAARIAGGNALALELGELRPVQQMYGRFKSALARYREMEQASEWVPVPTGRVLQLGMEDVRVPLIRRRLAQSGDFPGTTLDSRRFDPGLEEALRRFQARHGLEADGVFGAASVRALNQSVADRMGQIKVNLERARWLLSEVRGRYLLVDPAGRRVLLMDGGRAFEYPADFAPEARAGGDFRATMRYFVVHPDWVLPPGLVEAQVAPLARRAPAELRARGLEVFAASGELIDAEDADWSRPADVIVRQMPHPRSFLGVLRFSMPNSAQIFMHGGPLEGDALRGSIRLDDPVGLARALAGAQPAGPVQRLGEALTSVAPATLPLETGIPVLYGSWTAWVDADGTVVFRSGYEARDAAILAGLRQRAGEG